MDIRLVVDKVLKVGIIEGVKLTHEELDEVVDILENKHKVELFVNEVDDMTFDILKISDIK